MPEKSIIAAIAAGVTSFCVGAGTIIFSAMKMSNQSEEIKAIKKTVIFEDRFIEFQKAQTTEHGHINKTLERQNNSIEDQNKILMEILGKLPRKH